jgi:hypothetical protein
VSRAKFVAIQIGKNKKGKIMLQSNILTFGIGFCVVFVVVSAGVLFWHNRDLFLGHK